MRMIGDESAMRAKAIGARSVMRPACSVQFAQDASSIDDPDDS